MIRRLICWIKGHRWYQPTDMYGLYRSLFYRCSRCGETKSKIEIDGPGEVITIPRYDENFQKEETHGS